MTRLLRPNGTALLTLVAALLVATWPFFGSFYARLTHRRRPHGPVDAFVE